MIQFGERNGKPGLFSAKISSDDYLSFVVTELKPFIDSTYSTHSEMDNTSIAGSSMGGLISMYAICEYPTIFGGAACLSTHWTGTFETEGNPIPAQFMHYLNAQLPDPENHKIYFDYGTATLDATYEPFQLQADSILVSHGFGEGSWKSMKFEGHDHSERSWRERMDIPLRFLLEP